MPELTLRFECGEDSLSVRRFAVREALSELFSITITARSPRPDLDLETIIGKPASLHVAEGWFSAIGGGRLWGGVCSQIEQVQAEPTGLSTYQLRIVPALWLLTQRRDLRTFQHLSALDIALLVLARWNIEPRLALDRARYPKLEYKVQYDESDFAFLSRILAEAGVTFLFEDSNEEATERSLARLSKLVLTDAPSSADPRPGPPIPYVDNPTAAPDTEIATHVRLAREVRPGAYVLRDHDFRNPGLAVVASATPDPADAPYEQYRYQPGSFLVEVEKGGGTPAADDKGFARHDPRAGAERVTRLLAAERLGSRVVSFASNAVDLRAGVVFSIGGHPHSELAETRQLLVTEALGEGAVDRPWAITCRALFAETPYHPAQPPDKPRISGVQSAFVVGPPGQEIHTDEHGRVRVQFHWDQQGRNDDNSSPWIRVGQGWAGTGFGMVALPRVGQEVLVGFLDGDPELPLVVGRVFDARNVAPHRLPEHRTVSAWRTRSTPDGTGYNEIAMEDAKGKELVGIRAERDLRKLVRRDETSTVGRHRSALVQGDEVETTNGDHTTFVGGDRRRLVKGSETERTDGDKLVHVGKDQHLRTALSRRERVGADSHLTVKGSHRVHVGKSLSLAVDGDRFEKVGKRYALAVGEEIHVKAGSSLVIEAQDLTLKGPGGFIRIDAGGVTIKGTLVKINSAGGSPADGGGVAPESPEEPAPAIVEEPEMDDVSATGHGPR